MTSIHVSDSYLLKAGKELDFTNEYAFFLDGPGSPVLTIAGTLNVVQNDPEAGGNIAIQATGDSALATVNVRQGGLVAVNMTSAGFAVGVLVGGQSQAGAVNNAGTIQVSAVGDSYGVEFESHGSTCANTGLIDVHAGNYAYGATGFVDLVNKGSIEVSGDVATGVWIYLDEEAGGDPAGGGSLRNLGAITVTGTGPCVGAQVAGDFSSTGKLTVHGGIGASVGLDYTTTVGGLASNAGKITVTGDDGATGVQISADRGGDAVFGNSGTIRADIAFSAMPVYDFGRVELTNSGRMFGDILLTAQNDELRNSGKIVGEVTLGDGDDLYRSIGAGKLTGAFYGGGGDDELIGGKGGDHFIGDTKLAGVGDGSDTITGGGGADTLAGGGASDVFVYLKLSDSAGAKADLITDLQTGDHIDLSHIDADATHGGDQAFHLVGGFSGQAGELVLSYDAGAGQTTIAGDVDGDGAADFLILATGDQSGFTSFEL